MKRDWVSWAILWAVMTVIGEAAFFMSGVLPEAGSEEAVVFDTIFSVLTGMGIAVFMFIVSALIISAVKFRVPDDDDSDGPYIPDNRHLVHWWERITIGLTLVLIIFTGFWGLREFTGSQSADVVIGVQGQQWSWIITHENGATATDELVVPVDLRVRYDVSSPDVIHAFWVPAWRTKIDALPGRPTVVYVTADVLGDGTDYGDGHPDPQYRLQCAELCGLDHGQMVIPVRVVSQSDYESYIASLEGGS